MGQRGASVSVKQSEDRKPTVADPNPVSANEKMKHHYKDAVMIRKQDALNIEVLNDTGWNNKFGQGNKSAVHFKDYKIVQTCVKSKIGLGKPIYVKFYANMNLAKPSEEIDYDFRSLGEDVTLI